MIIKIKKTNNKLMKIKTVLEKWHKLKLLGNTGIFLTVYEESGILSAIAFLIENDFHFCCFFQSLLPFLNCRENKSKEEALSICDHMTWDHTLGNLRLLSPNQQMKCELMKGKTAALTIIHKFVHKNLKQGFYSSTNCRSVENLNFFS